MHCSGNNICGYQAFSVQRFERSCVFVDAMERTVGISLALVSGALAAGATVAAASAGFPITTIHWGVGGAVAASAVAMAIAIGRGSVGTRVALVAVALLAVPCLWAAEFLGTVDLAALRNEAGLVTVMFSLGIAVAAYGLFRRRVWARWVAWAGGGIGVLSQGLNGVGTLTDPSMFTWAHALALACCGLLLAGLTGSEVRQAFDEADHTDSVWRTQDTLINRLRWTVLANLAAIPMLMIYAWNQPVVPETKLTAIVLAVSLTTGVVLTVCRKVAGALLITVGGACLLGQTAVTLVLATGDYATTIAAYYACFWIPAGLMSAATGLGLVSRIRARR